MNYGNDRWGFLAQSLCFKTAFSSSDQKKYQKCILGGWTPCLSEKRRLKMIPEHSSSPLSNEGFFMLILSTILSGYFLVRPAVYFSSTYTGSRFYHFDKVMVVLKCEAEEREQSLLKIILWAFFAHCDMQWNATAQLCVLYDQSQQIKQLNWQTSQLPIPRLQEMWLKPCNYTSAMLEKSLTARWRVVEGADRQYLSPLFA